MKDTSNANERVGRYQVLEPIGAGPTGIVSRAKVFGVAGFERQFAIKRFHGDLTAGPTAQALSTAARAYGSLEHPRIARMSEFGVAQGQTFTAVELVAGLDTFRLMQETKLAGTAIAPGGALALVSQAARAVGYAHGRGLWHLGLSPTNVIVTADGDVKVTDFGILSATMSAIGGSPIEVPRLASRVPYLAPEQLAGEQTSAASDVFVLGVIAYELVTGQRAYRGDSPAQVAQAILAGPPIEPPLPRPIVRVLQRCLARSPFERFPDARALADALDAALRVAPVPGTRKDIGAQIKLTLDRYAQLNEGNLSGMVALNLPTPSVEPRATSDTLQAPIATPTATPPGPSATIPDMRAVAITTVPGLPPPPIPVPPGIAGGLPPATSTLPPMQSTMLGVSSMKKAQVPSIVPPIAKKNGPSTPPPPPAPTPPSASKPPPFPRQATPSPEALPKPPPPADDVVEPSGLIELEPSQVMKMPPSPLASTVGTAVAVAPTATAEQMEHWLAGVATPPPADAPTLQDVRAPAHLMANRMPKPTPGQNFESATGEMSTAILDPLIRRASTATEAPPLGRALTAPEIIVEGELPPPVEMPKQEAAAEPANGYIDPFAEDDAAPPAPAPEVEAARPADPVPPAPDPLYNTPVPTMQPPPIEPPPTLPPAARSRAPMVAVAILVGAGVIGGGGFFAYRALNGSSSTETVAAKPGPTKGSGSVVATAPADAAAVAMASDAAAAASAVDAGTAAVAVKPAPSDFLEIASKPAGARVFIDGADQGMTPVKLPGTADRHTMAVLLPGHDLYIAEVDGKGMFDVALKPVTPSGGGAGIKVQKCKDKQRYYVYVDGLPTGMTCPTERIDTSIGPHTVEVYDIVTEARRKFEIEVKDDRLSVRVRIED